MIRWRVVGLRAFFALALILLAHGVDFEVRTVTTLPPPHIGGVFYDGAASPDGGLLFYTDEKEHVLRSVNLATGEISVLSGTLSAAGHRDGRLTDAQFFQPLGLCLSPCDGHLYVADGSGSVIRRVDFTNERKVTTVAGAFQAKGMSDGPGIEARFSAARAPICLANGSIIISELSGPSIKIIDPPPGTQCTAAPPAPPPAPEPTPHHSGGRAGAVDILLHVLALIGAVAVFMLILMVLVIFVLPVGGVYIRKLRRRHQGPAPQRRPEVKDYDGDLETGTLDEPLLLPPAPRPSSPDLISFSPTTPSSPTTHPTPPSTSSASAPQAHLPTHPTHALAPVPPPSPYSTSASDAAPTAPTSPSTSPSPPPDLTPDPASVTAATPQPTSPNPSLLLSTSSTSPTAATAAWSTAEMSSATPKASRATSPFSDLVALVSGSTRSASPLK